jgi:hypothetical protein
MWLRVTGALGLHGSPEKGADAPGAGQWRATSVSVISLEVATLSQMVVSKSQSMSTTTSVRRLVLFARHDCVK